MAAKIESVVIPPAALHLARDYQGHIFISDIDKTYLATQIDSLGGLIRAAFENPERKNNVPGFSTILRAVRRGGQSEPAKNPLFFVSASPPQMSVKLNAKMELDGVEHDGIIFKNQLEYVRQRKFKKLREQIGFKLGALLSLWAHLPQGAKLVLFGDDSESDAVVYSLFTEVAAGSVRNHDLLELLRHLGVFREEALQIAWMSRRLGPPVDPLEVAFINLETGSQPSYYARFGSRIFASDNSLQTALALFERGLIREQAVRSVARDLVFRHDFKPEALLRSLEAGAQRGLFMISTLDELWPVLHGAGTLPVPRPRAQSEGAVSLLRGRDVNQRHRPTLQELKARYSDEGRY